MKDELYTDQAEEKKDKVIEFLRCALINCDNIERSGKAMVEIVKIQIEQAIQEVGK